LESAVRRLRAALVELGASQAADVDSVPLPRTLDQLVRQIRQRIGAGGVQPPIGIVHRQRAGFAPSSARTLGAAVAETVVATRVQEPEAVPTAGAEQMISQWRR
jgi:hypothetical protein